ncbi:hypothetical protein Tco_0090614 [Tanacetum coccineum]
MHLNRGGVMMQMQRLPSLTRLQMMLETRTTRFQTTFRSEEVFGYILLFKEGLLGIKDSLMLFELNETRVVPADSSSSIPADNVPAGSSSSIPADYVSAGHVRIC